MPLPNILFILQLYNLLLQLPLTSKIPFHIQTFLWFQFFKLIWKSLTLHFSKLTFNQSFMQVFLVSCHPQIAVISISLAHWVMMSNRIILNKRTEGSFEHILRIVITIQYAFPTQEKHYCFLEEEAITYHYLIVVLWNLPWEAWNSTTKAKIQKTPFFFNYMAFPLVRAVNHPIITFFPPRNIQPDYFIVHS